MKYILIIFVIIWVYFNFISFLLENKLNDILENIKLKGEKKELEYGVSFILLKNLGCLVK